MKSNIQLLLLEDNEVDVQLLKMFLLGEGIAPDIIHVDTQKNFEKHLRESPIDIIISDFTLPSYNGLSALRLAREIRPFTPFVFFSGTIGEEAAVEALKNGASDYVLKQRPKRLRAAIERAFRESQQREEHRRAEEQITALVRLLDMATDAVIMRDITDKVLFWNQGATRLYGWALEEVIGQIATDPKFSNDAKAFAIAKEETLRQGQWSGELSQKRKDGQKIEVLSRWTLMRSERGQPERILVLNSDITERRKLESQFLRAQRLESVGTLASGVAHDLNNVLAPILMGSELLLESPLDRKSKEMVETIRASAHRGAEVVKQVLTFVRGTEGKRVRIELAEVINETRKFIANTFPKNIEVISWVSKDLFAVSGDPTQLNQALMNLCINSRDAMPKGGTLKLCASNVAADGGKPAQVKVEVEDTGEGMPPEIMDRIFDPFFTTKEPGKGTGLGLATVCGIIQSHSGTIHVSSQVGNGTKFEIFLPAEAEERPLRNDDSSVNLARKGKGELILIVDDEPEIRRLMAKVLSQNNFEILTAADGDMGLIQFAQNKEAIRLVITDMMMPGLEGGTFVKSIHIMKPGTKVIATSGLAEHHNLPGAISFLRKPFSAAELLKIVHATLNVQETPPG